MVRALDSQSKGYGFDSWLFCKFASDKVSVDNIKTWTGLSVDESVRMTEDRDKWRKYVHGVANPQIEDG